MASLLSEKDIVQINKYGASIETINQQLNDFKKGFPFINLSAPATPQRGIVVLSDIALNNFVLLFEKTSLSRKVDKFVPASGAASRMFKNLFAFKETYNKSDSSYQKYLAEQGFNSVFNFITNIQKFAFYDELKSLLTMQGNDIDKCIEEHNFISIIDTLLLKKGLNFANLPKGLLTFHAYTEGNRTSIAEHLTEGVEYAKNNKQEVNIHFTLSPEHIDLFNNHISELLPKFENKYQVKFNISHSIQKKSTDTIAVDMQNAPFREHDNSLLFRPAGHGALIENLNDLKGDIIFIKNIDNVVPDKLKQSTYTYKKAIGGLLISLQEKVFNYLRILEAKDVSDAIIAEIAVFAKTALFTILPTNFDSLQPSDKKELIFKKLNRPIRICGMVKNEGEPGGGPFWVFNKSGDESLQIIESSQIDMKDEKQKTIFSGATHFNPVDLVCAVKDFKGNNFDLLQYRDPETGFISIKSKDGKDLKAMELPGLWNGAMADWITIFVEVPISTFNPVKVINDLLRKEHQSK